MGSNPPFDTLRNGIVHIGVGPSDAPKRWLGTGFLVDGYCTFATAKHILKDANEKEIIVRFQAPTDRKMVLSWPARILFQSPDRDIAFLRIDRVKYQPCNSRRLYIFPLLDAGRIETITGAEVWIIGHPVLIKGQNLDIPILRSGLIACTEIDWKGVHMLLLDLPGGPGFSGSPVILKNTGEVIGVVFGPGPTERVVGFEWATQITKEDYQKAAALK